MAFTVADFEDLYRLLAEHPEWRNRLRPLILGDEFLEVPGRLERIEQLLAQSVERQAAFEERQAAFEANMAAFHERQTAFEERQAAFEANMAAFAERMDRFDARMDRLEERMDRLDARLEQLVAVARAHERRMNRMDGRMGNIEGQLLEQRYALNINAGFGSYLRRPELIHYLDLEGLTAATESGAVTAEQIQRIAHLDYLVQGRSRADGEPLLLAVEISQTIEIHDVDRAERAASALRIAGYNARGFVGGFGIEDIVRTAADAVGVIVDLRRAPDAAVA